MHLSWGCHATQPKPTLDPQDIMHMEFGEQDSYVQGAVHAKRDRRGLV